MYVNVHMCMYVHVSHPKPGAAIGPISKARQDTLVGPSTASRTHELCRHRQPKNVAEQAARCDIEDWCKLDGRDSPRNGLVGPAGPASSMLMIFLTSRMAAFKSVWAEDTKEFTTLYQLA